MITLFMKKIIITGGCGFIGHHFVEHVYKNTDWKIIVIDKLSYASSGFERMRDTGTLNDKRIKVFTSDLILPLSEGLIKEIGTDIDYIVHMAAETHVDNSITDPKLFINNNIQSTVNLLEYARNYLHNLKTFFYFSTDEVFGPALGNTLYKEWDRHKPTNPYSASKSAAEQICIAYENTYKIPLMIVNVMNAFGERQHVEKFIPLCIKKILNNEKIFIHSYPDKKTSGTRFYIHARNIAEAVLFLIKNGTIGEKYNISGEREVSNLEIAQLISKFMNKNDFEYEMVDFHSSRPGHDLRYGLDGTKLFNMGFKLPLNFEESLKKTVEWTLQNQKWLEN
jgi:dTDP-glucose 4,6-dehydratase